MASGEIYPRIGLGGKRKTFNTTQKTTTTVNPFQVTTPPKTDIATGTTGTKGGTTDGSLLDAITWTKQKPKSPEPSWEPLPSGVDAGAEDEYKTTLSEFESLIAKPNKTPEDQSRISYLQNRLQELDPSSVTDDQQESLPGGVDAGAEDEYKATLSEFESLIAKPNKTTEDQMRMEYLQNRLRELDPSSVTDGSGKTEDLEGTDTEEGIDLGSEEDILPEDESGRTYYDMMRERIEADAAEAKDEYMESIRRRLAAQGIEGGLAEKQMAEAEREFDARVQKSLSAVDMKELEDVFKSGESEKERELKRELQSEQIGSTERLAEWRLDFDRDVQEDRVFLENRGIDLKEAELYGYEDEQGNRIPGLLERAQQELDLKEDSLDLQREELFGYDEVDPITGETIHIPGKYDFMDDEQKRLADQLYGYKNEDGDYVPGTLQLSEWELESKNVLNGIVRDADTGEFNIEETLEQRNAIMKQKAEGFYNAGASQMPLSQLGYSDIETLRSEDPLAYHAYIAGLAGLDKSIWDAELQRRIGAQAGMLTALSPKFEEMTSEEILKVFSDVEDLIPINPDIPMGIGGTLSTGDSEKNDNTGPKALWSDVGAYADTIPTERQYTSVFT